MKNEAVNLFIDSGIGGITTMLQTQKLLKNENFVYVADFKNAPYGNKTKQEIKKIVTDNIKKFYAEFCLKSVVIACNTATAGAIFEVRKQFPNLVVIGAEPAIRPAIQSGKKRILVLGTKFTLKHSGLVKLFKGNPQCLIKFLALPELATLIDENYMSNPQKIQSYLVEKLAKLKGEFDGVVLGCTHFVIVGKAIKNILGYVTLFNGNFGIAKRLRECLDILSLTNNNQGSVTLVSTEPSKNYLLLKYHQELTKRRDELCAV